MKTSFSDFIALNDAIEKQALVGRLELALAAVHHSGAFLAQHSGVPIGQIHAMLSLEIRKVSRTEIEKVLAVAAAA
jgi:hypothetical protein